MPETVHPYRAEVEQFRFVCYRTKGVFHRMDRLLRRVAADENDFDVLADGAVVGRILKVHAAPVGTPWMWTLAFWHHEGRTPTHRYAATREAAVAAFAKSWRRE